MSVLYRVLCCGALLCSANLLASPSVSKSYDLCMDHSDGVTLRMIECIGAEYQRKDQQLNQNYQHLMTGLSAERKTQLRNVQRKWMTYRDANCQFYADPDGGSLARVAANACLLRMTAERAEELRQSVSP